MKFKKLNFLKIVLFHMVKNKFQVSDHCKTELYEWLKFWQKLMIVGTREYKSKQNFEFIFR